MRRFVSCTVLFLALAALLASVADAASSARPARRTLRGESAGVDHLTMLRLHGGLSSPTGDFGDAFDGGLGLGADVAWGVSRSVLLSAGIAYHAFDGDLAGVDASVVPITFNVATVLPSSGTLHPWVGGGVGAYNVNVDFGTFLDPLIGAVSLDESETNFGINFGAGFGAPAGDRGAWGMGVKFHHVFEGDTFDSLDFVTLQVGYGFFL